MVTSRPALAPVALVATLLATLAACGPTGTPGIAHATGATELVFRISLGGGFAGLPMQPRFSLYGDGSVIYLDPAEVFPAPVGEVHPQRPYRIATLSEERVQAILGPATSAIGPARDSYRAQGADYFTYLFKLRAGGIDHEVSVFGLEAGGQTGPDAAAWAAFRSLGDAVEAELARLSGSTVYSPAAFQVRLSIHIGPADVQAWPWPELTIGDFTPTQGNVARAARLTAAQVANLGISSVEGGLSGLVLGGPDGNLYDVEITPLLPEESG